MNVYSSPKTIKYPQRFPILYTWYTCTLQSNICRTYRFRSRGYLGVTAVIVQFLVFCGRRTIGLCFVPHPRTRSKCELRCLRRRERDLTQFSQFAHMHKNLDDRTLTASLTPHFHIWRMLNRLPAPHRTSGSLRQSNPFPLFNSAQWERSSE